jgi:hypothetical protein
MGGSAFSFLEKKKQQKESEQRREKEKPSASVSPLCTLLFPAVRVGTVKSGCEFSVAYGKCIYTKMLHRSA